MRHTILLFLFLVLTQSLLAQKPTYIALFDVDKHQLNAEETQRLNAFASKLATDNDLLGIELVGHTDSDADNTYNRRLSSNRVNTIRDLLVKAGVDTDITTSFNGEDAPLNNNATDEEKRLNRRVEIFIFRIGIEPGPEPEGDIRELYRILEQEKQVHCIHPKGDTIIRFEQGTIIYVPPFAFGEQNVKCIEIWAKEFYKKSDMVLENLSTTSNGRLLESEGMIYLEASADGQDISLASGKELTIFTPTQKLRDDVAIYNGERDAHTDIMNWVANSAEIMGLNVANLRDCLNERGAPSPSECPRCKFFTCRIERIGKGFKGIVNSEQHQENKYVRECQREYRKAKRENRPMRAIRNTPNLNVGFDTLAVSPCADLQNLMDQYGVDNINDLILAMNKDLLDKYGVSTMEELRVAMEKEKMEALEKKIEVGAADIADLSYYMFNSSRMRWINVDALSKLPGERKDMLTNLPSDQSTDCKLVFEKVKGIIPAFAHAANFYFGEVPMKNECWIIGMRYRGGKAYLSIELTESKPKYEGFNFKEMSPDQIKEAMKVIN